MFSKRLRRRNFIDQTTDFTSLRIYKEPVFRSVDLRIRGVRKLSLECLSSGCELAHDCGPLLPGLSVLNADSRLDQSLDHNYSSETV